MGTCGTGISSNDTYCEVYEEFFSMYNEGKEVDEITVSLRERFKETIQFAEDHTNFWFALAKAQWECKALRPEIFEKVKSIIDGEEDIRIWRELEADERDIRARNKVLNKFLNTISTEKESPKKRKKIRYKPAIFLKGDCIAFHLHSGNYGGALVLETFESKEAGYNLIVKTRINQETKPTINDFQSTEVLFHQITQFGITNEQEDAQWFFPDGYKKFAHLFEVIGRMEPLKQIDIKNGMIIAGGWDLLISQTEEQFENEINGVLPKKRIRLIDYIKESHYK